MIYFISLAPSAFLERELHKRGLSWKTVKSLKSPPVGSLAVYLHNPSSPLEPHSQSLLAAVVPSKQKPLENQMTWDQGSWEESLISFLPFFENWLSLYAKGCESEKQLSLLLSKTNQLVDQFQRDLDFAASIQKTLLPSSEISFPGISLTTKYIPAAGLGGDYFDIFELSDKRHLGILVADSQTHGMAAALLSVLLKLQVDEFKSLASTSHSLVEHLNQALYQIHLSKLPGLNFFFGILDRATLSFDFTSAGNLTPLLFSRGGLKSLNQNSLSNPPLGAQSDVSFLPESFQLQPGDLLFLHTDGLKAAFPKEKTLFSALETLFSSSKKIDPLHFQTELLAKLNQVKEDQSELPDDVTLIQLFIDQKALYLAQSK